MTIEETESGDEKKTKSQKKIVKKYHKKALNLLKEYVDVEIAVDDTTPTCQLFVGNGGMLCGVNREELLTLCSRHGQVTDLVMLPKKSYAFVSYQDVNSACRAFKLLSGHIYKPTNPGEPSVPFYLKFLKTKSLDFAKSASGLEMYPVEHGATDLLSGLILREDFIDERYEKELFEYFSDQCRKQQASANTLKHRSVVHFGYQFLYGSNNIDRSNPMEENIQDICQPLLNKMISEKLIGFVPDQLTVNQYLPGQGTGGIPPHIDTHSAFEDGIISVSLNSQVTMEFTHPDNISKPVLLPRRSVLVMTGESRYLWSHGIVPRKYDIMYTKDSNLTMRERGIRLSLTFRKILHEPCECLFPDKCDSQQKQLSDGMKKSGTNQESWFIPESSAEACNLEGELVYKVYEEIADHFSSTRHSPWPRVTQFLNTLQSGSIVADVGCGNGKYLGVNKELVTLGSDRSFNLASICEERGFQVIVSDCLKLPYRDNSFDACICIAVIHHLSTEERRADAVMELVRIVQRHGRILIYVWALEQQVNLADITDKDGRVKENDVPGTMCSVTENLLGDFGRKDENKNKFVSGGLGDRVGPNHIGNCTQLAQEKQSIQVCEGRNMFQQQDLLIPWHLKGKQTKKKREYENENSVSGCDGNNGSGEEKVFHRFYHVFKVGELRALCERVPNVTVEEIYLDCGNWCAILCKI